MIAPTLFLGIGGVAIHWDFAFGSALLGGLAFAAWRASLPKMLRGTVRCEPDQLSIHDDHGGFRIYATNVADGYAVADPPGVALTLRDGRTMRAWDLPDLAPSDVLTALGVDPARTIFRVTLRTTVGPSVRGLLVFLASCSAAFFADMLYLDALYVWGLLLAPFMIWYVVFRRTQAVIGIDGIRVENGPFRRFIGYHAIARAELGDASTQSSDASSVSAASATLALHRSNSNATPIKLPILGLPSGERQELVARIRARIVTASGTAAAVLALERRGRTVEQWRRDLASEQGLQTDYRSVPLEHERIEAVLQNPHSTLEHRIGAAFFLVAKDSEIAKARIRVAASTLADPHSRAALAATLEDESVAQSRAITRGLKRNTRA